MYTYMLSLWSCVFIPFNAGSPPRDLSSQIKPSYKLVAGDFLESKYGWRYIDHITLRELISKRKIWGQHHEAFTEGITLADHEKVRKFQ